MKFKTHAVFGILCALFTFSYFATTTSQKIIFFIFAFFGSVFPDIDIHNSWINRKLFLSQLIAGVTKHRGIFHSLFLATPLSYLLYYFNHLIGTAFFIGYISHLLIDSLNHMGVNLIHPIQKLHISGFIEVGSAKEMLLFIFFLIVLLVKARFVFF